MRQIILSACLTITSVGVWTVPAAAQNEGQADLDMATDLQITAETLGDLERVIKLAESAMTISQSTPASG